MMIGIDDRALVDIVITMICLCFASYKIGGYIWMAILGDTISRGLLIFFAVVALVCGLLGGHAASVAIAARQNQMNSR